MKTFNTQLLVAVSAILLMASGSIAGTKGRIIPNGSVSFQKNGTVVSYTEQTVLDDNALISCSDACMAKLEGLSLAAADGTKFAVKEINNIMNLYVEQGLVQFTLTNTSQQLAFYTKDGQYVKTEGFIVPASTAGAVSGFMQATESGSMLGMNQGSMVLTTANGLQTVNPGHSFQVAIAEVNPSPAGGAGGAGAGGAGAGGAGAGGAAAGGAAAGLGGAFAGLSGLTIAAGVVAATTVVVATTTVVNNNKDDNNPASPN